MLFHERYRELIGDNEFLDKFCGYFQLYIRKKLVQIMEIFNEPKEIQVDRYNSKRIRKTDAFQLAFDIFQEKTSSDFFTLISVSEYGNISDAISLSRLAYIFSIIELQFQELSEKEKVEFSKELNSFFNQYDIKFRMIDGRLIKIDSKQFECDLKLKAVESLKELKDTEPKFQSAFTELTNAIEYYDKGDYESAINNSAKSYESILKVILGTDEGNAEQLTTQYMNSFLTVPRTMKPSGFRTEVLMVLHHLRNRCGAVHGAGTKEVSITKPFAKLAVNLAAALDTYLIEEYAERLSNSEQAEE